MSNRSRVVGIARLVRATAILAMVPVAVGGFAKKAAAVGECAEEDFFGCFEFCNDESICRWQVGEETWCGGTMECRDCPTSPQLSGNYCVLEIH